MPFCTSCGAPAPELARFCAACGEPLVSVAGVAETRRTVTALFQDVTGSTALNESLDSEAVRHVMTRYFTEMKAELEHHGGTVEKFIGDAVMALFGLPQAREDDPLRAVRAAAGMRGRLEQLNERLEADFGVRLRVRTGVNTGEVVAGAVEHGQPLALGDPINVAARLEQAAQPDEILIGEETLRLVRNAVVVEPVEPLEVKGKNEPVPAFRLLEVRAGAPPIARRFDIPFVGRASELDTLQEAFARACAERRCVLATVVGEPGIGKSRLALELALSLDGEARFARGRCLAYGEGITFLPIGELVRDAVGIGETDTPERAIARIATLVPDGARQVGEALGLVDGDTDAGTLFYEIRRLLETLAAERPLICVIDDIHWAEEAFLDFLEYLAGFSRGAAITVLCLARTELLEIRPHWPVTIRLQPLGAGDAASLTAALATEQGLASDLCERITTTAEGNPLFAEQLVALAAESDDSDPHTVPATIQAVLAERLNRLTPPQLALIQRAAVIGRVFTPQAVTALCPEDGRAAIASTLQALVRRGMTAPEPDSGADDTFRFSHVLVRDAAYTTVPKLARADLHERHAGWLEGRAHDRLAESQEVIGFHLEQASLLRSELHIGDERAAEIGRRAAEHLGAAGKRALTRRDVAAAEGLLSRATALYRAEAEADRVQLGLDLAVAHAERGQFDRAAELYTEIVSTAERAGLVSAEWRARVGAELIRTERERTRLDDALQLGEEAATRLGEVGDARGMLEAYQLVHDVLTDRGRFRLATEVAGRALAIAQEVGWSSDLLWWRGMAIFEDFFGPAPVPEPARELEAILEAARQEGLPFHEAFAADALAWLRAMEGRFADAQDLIETREVKYAGLGMEIWETLQPGRLHVAILSGNYARADEIMVEVCELTERLGHADLAVALLARAELMNQQGRFEEAGEMVERGRQYTSPEDLDAQLLLYRVEAGLLAERGDLARAEALVRRAVTLADAADRIDDWAHTRLALSDVLERRGEPVQASRAASEAAAIWDAKGNVVLAAKAHAVRERLG